MLRGEYADAWRVSDEAVRARAGVPCWHWPRHLQYVWDGAPLDGKRVLVRCYHGLGDTIQFVRFAPRLRAVAAEVIVWAQPSLLPLVRTVRGVDRALALHDGTPEVAYDADVEIMELAHVFRAAPGTLPADVPYLHLPRAARTGLPADGRLHVGLVWGSGDWDPRRSIDPALLAPLADVPGVALHVLQRGAPLAGRPEGFGVDAAADTPWETACTMAALDLVITVDSMPAHLAGALGRPTWTLLHADADWRWLRGRADSPWYPTMRLFRQATPGDWAGVVARVADALAQRAAL